MPARPGDRDALRGVTCSRSEDAIAWTQGQLPPGEEKDFAAHLAECAACRAEAAEAEKVLALLRSPGEPPPAVDLVPRVLAGLDAESARRRRPAAWRLAAAAALAIAGTALAIQAWKSPGKLPADSGEEELASERAVEWLEHAQEPSGGFYAARWGGLGDYDVGLTGLAALAFLSRPGPRNQHAAMALDFLLSAQSADGRIGPEFAGAVYNHGIATVAILEAFGTSREERLRAPIDRAVSYIERTRCREGGWGYLGDDAAGPTRPPPAGPSRPCSSLARSAGRASTGRSREASSTSRG